MAMWFAYLNLHNDSFIEYFEINGSKVYLRGQNSNSATYMRVVVGMMTPLVQIDVIL